MAEDEQDESSKTEEASERKLERAREEGNVPLSQEVKSWFMLFAALMMLWGIAPLTMKQTAALSVKFIEKPAELPISCRSAGIARLVAGNVVGFVQSDDVAHGIVFIVGGRVRFGSNRFYVYAQKVGAEMGKAEPVCKSDEFHHQSENRRYAQRPCKNRRRRMGGNCRCQASYFGRP